MQGILLRALANGSAPNSQLGLFTAATNICCGAVRRVLLSRDGNVFWTTDGNGDDGLTDLDEDGTEETDEASRDFLDMDTHSLTWQHTDCIGRFW